MKIKVSDIPVTVNKKKIKNINLQVKPPYGEVFVSVPKAIDEKTIKIYVRTHISWIRKQIDKFQKQERAAKRQYVSGETIYIWGKQYYVVFIPSSRKNNFEIKGNKVYLSMRKNSTVEQREKYVREQYRVLLKEKINKLLPKWEKITNLHCNDWQTKYMLTKWGSCNTATKKLWFNVQLAQKPIRCLEYIILHELIHLKERTHNANFIKLMDMYMKDWRIERKELNELRLDYYVSYR